MASVTSVQTSELRPSPAPASAPKKGDPFAMLLDSASSNRVSAPEPRRRAVPKDAPRVQGSQKPERLQPKPDARPVSEKTKSEASATSEKAAAEDTKSAAEKAGAKETANGQMPDTAVTVDTKTAVEDAVILPVEPAGTQQGAADEEDAAELVVEADDADGKTLIAADAGLAVQENVPAVQTIQKTEALTQAAAPETAFFPVPAAAVESVADAAAERPVAVAPVKNAADDTKPNAQAAVAADAEAALAGEEAPQTASPAAKSEQIAHAGKSVASNHAEVRDSTIAENSERFRQSTNVTNVSKPEVTAQTKEHASMKALEHVPTQSNAENSTPRQLALQTPAVMPEPVRALAGSINPINLRSAGDGPGNATPLNANAIGVEIASLAKEGMRRFDIRLDPPELGRVDVRLEVSPEGKTSLRLVVERPETLDLFQRDARNLERALQSAGLQTDEGGLEFTLRDHGQNGLTDMGADGRRAERQNDFLAAAIEDAEPAPASLDHYARSVFARGGVDIRI